ncbi:MAG: HAD-IA family hydrolase [Burkholderiales bacterium]|nr:HAD-IA family hydrolase [Burkholderiales bacterium]
MKTVWLFDLDNTLHDAGRYAFPALNRAMAEYVRRELAIDDETSQQLRHHYWLRYGATLIGLVRHHGVKPAHFLHDTHNLPDLEANLNGHRHDFAAIRRLPGRKFILTNAPRAYALRILRALRVEHLFDGLISIEDMAMFGQLRPKPDARMLRAMVTKLRVLPCQCVLVEDTLAHQKAARRVGMRTVWMQRFARRNPAEPQPRWSKRPAYVDRVVRSLKPLTR